MENILKLDEVILSPGGFGSDSSLKKYIKFINEDKFRKENGIELKLLKRVGEGFSINLHTPTINKGKFKSYGFTGRIFFDGPLALAYSDGGTEFLKDMSLNDEKWFYDCGLYIPSLSSVLEFSHPIKNEKLLEMLGK